VEFAEYDDMMRRMLAIVVKMDTVIDEQRGINARLVEAIERLDITQARIETLLTRVLPPAENGREA
jgi:hypothetical protein